MSAVFLDTVGLIAVWDDSDQWHKSASPVFTEIIRSGRNLVTTGAVLLECGNSAARRPYRADVDDLRQFLRANGGYLEPTEPELESAWERYRHLRSGDAGIVDEISFAVMRRLGITEAFTHDRHFQAAGFTVLF